MSHPTYLDLDRLAVTGHGDAALHVADCPRCQGYIARVRRPGPMPAWALELAHRRRAVWPLIAVAAAVALAIVIAWQRAHAS